jgi:hypothetical protein
VIKAAGAGTEDWSETGFRLPTETERLYETQDQHGDNTVDYSNNKVSEYED